MKMKDISKWGQPFEIKSFEKERERLITLFRNNGIYDFQQNSIQFTASIDSTGQDTKIPVSIQIDNIQKRINDTLIEIPYTLHKINKIEVFIENRKEQGINKLYTDSINYNNLIIFK